MKGNVEHGGDLDAKHLFANTHLLTQILTMAPGFQLEKASEVVQKSQDFSLSSN